jgi:hypothetical protein
MKGQEKKTTAVPAQPNPNPAPASAPAPVAPAAPGMFSRMKKSLDSMDKVTVNSINGVIQTSLIYGGFGLLMGLAQQSIRSTGHSVKLAGFEKENLSALEMDHELHQFFNKLGVYQEIHSELWKDAVRNANQALSLRQKMIQGASQGVKKLSFLDLRNYKFYIITHILRSITCVNTFYEKAMVLPSHHVDLHHLRLLKDQIEKSLRNHLKKVVLYIGVKKSQLKL